MNLSQIEEKVLKFWKKEKIFEKSLQKSKGKPNFVFFEGPPTANGRPGMHHVEARAFKDIIPRYKTMRGFFVDRKAGWDTHGLPVELQVEKELGLKNKKDIEKYGIGKFNQKCKENVWKYKDEWEKLTERIGYWLDMKNPYITYENYYIESVWFILKKIFEKGLMYKGFKVVPHCPRCGTGLSSHEVAQGYKKVKENSIYVKFRIQSSSPQMRGGLRRGADIGSTSPSPSSTEEGRDLSNAYFLVWTTTPWTLPANVGLAVGENIKYVKVKTLDVEKRANFGNIEYHNLILAKDIYKKIQENEKHPLRHLFNLDYLYRKEDGETAVGNTRIIQELSGKDLVGIKYEPLFKNPNHIPSEARNQGSVNEVSGFFKENDLRVVAGDFVSTNEGTGIVHLAPAYGEDDLRVGEKEKLSVVHTVGQEGIIMSGYDIPGEGKFIKDADKDIVENLRERGLIFKEESYEHDYPFCWRCDSPLLYYAKDSWFIKMYALRNKLAENNKKINWEPAYIKDGRFGEFIREAKDWALSRERYWGTPLPIWICEKCRKQKIIGSAVEIKKNINFSGNKYFLMRHGEAESNVKKIINSDIKNNHIKITEKGKRDVVKAAKKLKKEKIDIIFASDFLRTKQTAEIVADEIGINKGEIIYDKRLRELNVGSFDNRRIEEYRNYFTAPFERFEKAPPGGENLIQLKKRGMEFIQEIDKKFKNKNILIVGHLDPLWMMFVGARGLNNEAAVKEYGQKEKFLEKGDFLSSIFYDLPRDENHVLDLHRPFIDEIKLKCGCGGEMIREKDVIDVWFDSGAMPFAQWGYPGASGSEEEFKQHYPADYISEAIDQTRGWFYTLLAIGTLMEECGVVSGGAPYKNVICLGHVLDKHGKKMSKSKGNVVDPWEMCEKFGADTLRWYLYTVNQAGDPKKFDIKDIQDKNRRVFGTLWNSLVFFQTYADKDFEPSDAKSKNILDKWIISVFNSCVNETINYLEKYDIVSAARAIENFIDDLSNWFIRRSRERFQRPACNALRSNAGRPKNAQEKNEATQTLYFTLLELSKLIAPFAPFISEEIYQTLTTDYRLPTTAKCESVHLCEFPEPDKKIIDGELEEQMKQVREIVAKGLALRMEKKIKIRQPLAKLRISARGGSAFGEKNQELIDLIKDEMNVKSVVFDKNIEKEIELDVEITPELKEEGLARELVRQIQQMRKEAGFVPSDVIVVNYQFSVINSQFSVIFSKWAEYIKQEVNAKLIEPYGENNNFDLEKEINLDGEKIKIGIIKLITSV